MPQISLRGGLGLSARTPFCPGAESGRILSEGESSRGRDTGVEAAGRADPARLSSRHVPGLTQCEPPSECQKEDETIAVGLLAAHLPVSGRVPSLVMGWTLRNSCDFPTPGWE